MWSMRKSIGDMMSDSWHMSDLKCKQLDIGNPSCHSHIWQVRTLHHLSKKSSINDQPKMNIVESVTFHLECSEHPIQLQLGLQIVCLMLIKSYRAEHDRILSVD